MNRYQPTRFTPALPVQAMQTFQVADRRDLAVVAACAEVGCPHWTHGWDTIVDERTQLGEMQAAYIRQGRSGRSYRELGRTAEGLTVFRFDAHQRCFTEHRTIPELYVVRGGDWRGNPTGMRRVHTRAADWVEHLREQTEKTVERARRG